MTAWQFASATASWTKTANSKCSTITFLHTHTHYLATSRFQQTEMGWSTYEHQNEKQTVMAT